MDTNVISLMYFRRVCHGHKCNILHVFQTSLSSDRTSGDLTATVNFLDRLSQKEKTPYNLPVWSPKETTEPLKVRVCLCVCVSVCVFVCVECVCVC